MSLPDGQDYFVAIQNPARTLANPGLQRCVPRLGPNGMPLVWAGGWAMTFQLCHPDGSFHALRCFTRPLEGLLGRYKAMQAFYGACGPVLQGALVPSWLEEQGIRIGGTSHPIVVMGWVEGEPLDEWIQGRLGRPGELAALRGAFRNLVAEMARAGFVHGDLQHGNILVRGGRPVLVDYDTVFPPGAAGLGFSLIGLPGFQHPAFTLRDDPRLLDRFPSLVIHTALEALELCPDLGKAPGAFADAILFHKEDFKDPANSGLFQALLREPYLKRKAEVLASCARGPVGALPDLETFLREALRTVHTLEPDLGAKGAKALDSIYRRIQVPRLGAAPAPAPAAQSLPPAATPAPSSAPPAPPASPAPRKRPPAKAKASPAPQASPPPPPVPARQPPPRAPKGAAPPAVPLALPGPPPARPAATGTPRGAPPPPPLPIPVAASPAPPAQVAPAPPAGPSERGTAAGRVPSVPQVPRPVPVPASRAATGAWTRAGMLILGLVGGAAALAFWVWWRTPPPPVYTPCYLEDPPKSPAVVLAAVQPQPTPEEGPAPEAPMLETRVEEPAPAQPAPEVQTLALQVPSPERRLREMGPEEIRILLDRIHNAAEEDLSEEARRQEQILQKLEEGIERLERLPGSTEVEWKEASGRIRVVPPQVVLGELRSARALTRARLENLWLPLRRFDDLAREGATRPDYLASALRGYWNLPPRAARMIRELPL